MVEWRIYASVNYNIIASDNVLSHGRRHPIVWTNDGLLSIRLQGTYFNEILFESFHLWKWIWKCRLQKWRPSCLDLNTLTKIINLKRINKNHTQQSYDNSVISSGNKLVKRHINAPRHIINTLWLTWVNSENKTPEMAFKWIFYI